MSITYIVILHIIIYIFIGFWVCWKFDWWGARDNEKRLYITDENKIACIATIIFVPFVLFLQFIRVFILGKWEQ